MVYNVGHAGLYMGDHTSVLYKSGLNCDSGAVV